MDKQHDRVGEASGVLAWSFDPEAFQLQIQWRAPCGSLLAADRRQELDPFVHGFAKENQGMECGPLNRDKDLADGIGQARIEGSAHDMEACEHGTVENAREGINHCGRGA